MTTVFIDTNIIRNESYLRSANARAFLKACALLGINVAIPEIVLDEAIGNYPKTLIERIASFEKAQKELGKFIDLDDATFSVEDAVEEFKEWLADLLKDHGVHIIPYPEITPKELVSKSYENKKPFKTTGEGHKDYIVWESIKHHIESNATPLPYYLLDNNSKDFCQELPDKTMVLHPELSSQIEIEEKRPKVFLSMKAFFDEIVSPMLPGATLEDIPHLSLQQIDELAKEKLESDISGYSAYGLEGVPFTNEVYASVAGDVAVDDRELKKIGDEVAITVSGTVLLEVEGFMEKWAYYSGDFKDDDIYISDGNWNDHVMAVSTTIETEFEVRLLYSPKEQKVVSYSVTLPQEIHNDWYK